MKSKEEIETKIKELSGKARESYKDALNSVSDNNDYVFDYIVSCKVFEYAILQLEWVMKENDK